MRSVFICDALRTPIGRYGGALSEVRADDLAALPIRELMTRHPQVDWAALDDVIYGCANQAGEDNRNVARMAALLAGLPQEVPGVTVNRLCGSGLDAVAMAARMIAMGEADLVIAGGVESMSRAPFVVSKAGGAFARDVQMYDTTIGWRFVNRRIEEQYGLDSMPETAENVAAERNISREDQDAFAIESVKRAQAAQQNGAFAGEIVPVTVTSRKGDVQVDIDEQPGRSDVAKIPTLKAAFRKENGTITAASSSSISDGAAAVVLLSAADAQARGLKPLARIVAHATHSQTPEWFTTAPVGAIQKVLDKAGWKVADVDLFEVNEAFAVVAMAPMRELGIAHDKLNVNGGACALGHPIGASGARLVVTLLNALKTRGLKRGIASLCIGGGEATAVAVEYLD
ncbi:MAG TPA: acetyl-CoA C-acyltransferase [Steroidobacteraceae bacterium]|nr:acetyl-CoA C-acyltransferase [Steroidobacteraceae bacterium]